jgi:CDP-diacylglycerol--glycerol-3-phosphate 3-phosphatidyltransferase
MLTDILRARTAFILDPIVTVLARTGVSPNFLTAMGMVAHLVPAWLISQGNMQLAALALLFIAPLDALDGALSRKIGLKQGNFGAFLDSTSDRLAEIILFIGFIVTFGRQGDTVMLVASYLAITGSLMVSYARARAEALNRSGNVGILSRVERYVVLTFFLFIDQPRIGVLLVAVLAYVTVAQRGLHIWQQNKQEPS